jgi:hypothetical protein
MFSGVINGASKVRVSHAVRGQRLIPVSIMSLLRGMILLLRISLRCAPLFLLQITPVNPDSG